MRTNLWTMLRIVVALFLFAAGPAAADPASQPGSADWPQWRGPNRDGIVPNSPKLLDAWPAKGPKLLWRSAEKISDTTKIPDTTFMYDDNLGGAGSISVSDGKVFLFAHLNKRISKVSITTEDLKSLGWSADLPEDVAKMIDEVFAPLAGRFGFGRGYTDEELEPILKKIYASLTPEQVAKFKPLIEARFHKGCKFSWKDLSDLAAKRADKEYDSFEAFAQGYYPSGGGDLTHPHNFLAGT